MGLKVTIWEHFNPRTILFIVKNWTNTCNINNTLYTILYLVCIKFAGLRCSPMFAMFIPSVPMVSFEIIKGPSTGDVGVCMGKEFCVVCNSRLVGTLRQSDLFRACNIYCIVFMEISQFHWLLGTMSNLCMCTHDDSKYDLWSFRPCNQSDLWTTHRNKCDCVRVTITCQSSKHCPINCNLYRI